MDKKIQAIIEKYFLDKDGALGANFMDASYSNPVRLHFKEILSAYPVHELEILQRRWVYEEQEEGKEIDIWNDSSPVWDETWAEELREKIERIKYASYGTTASYGYRITKNDRCLYGYICYALQEAEVERINEIIGKNYTLEELQRNPLLKEYAEHTENGKITCKILGRAVELMKEGLCAAMTFKIKKEPQVKYSQEEFICQNPNGIKGEYHILLLCIYLEERIGRIVKGGGTLEEKLEAYCESPEGAKICPPIIQKRLRRLCACCNSITDGKGTNMEDLVDSEDRKLIGTRRNDGTRIDMKTLIKEEWERCVKDVYKIRKILFLYNTTKRFNL